MSTIRAEHLNELTRSLEALRELLPHLAEGSRWGDGTATARHIAFHTSEAVDFWLRHVVLGEERPRDREAEFSTARGLDEMRASVDAAIEACRAVVERQPSLDAPVTPPPTMTEGRTHGPCWMRSCI